MCSLLSSAIICLGILAHTTVLDDVATRRYNAAWGGLSSNPAGYEVLLGVESCDYLGRPGYLLVGDRFYRALVVDCQQAAHRRNQPMSERGLLADVSREGLGYRDGWLILTKN